MEGKSKTKHKQSSKIRTKTGKHSYGQNQD